MSVDDAAVPSCSARCHPTPWLFIVARYTSRSDDEKQQKMISSKASDFSMQSTTIAMATWAAKRLLIRWRQVRKDVLTTSTCEPMKLSKHRLPLSELLPKGTRLP